MTIANSKITLQIARPCILAMSLPKLTFVAMSIVLSTYDLFAEDISIDFTSCVPIRLVSFLPFGSQTFEIVGHKDAYCLIKFGAEIERPQTNAELPIECKVPKSAGIIPLAVDEKDHPLKAIAQFCIDKTTGLPLEK